MMGDFNAKIGIDNRGNEEIIRQHGLGEMKGSGERLANLCALSNLVARGNVFQSKKIHKAALVSPDLSTESQIEIDHVYIDREEV